MSEGALGRHAEEKTRAWIQSANILFNVPTNWPNLNRASAARQSPTRPTPPPPIYKVCVLRFNQVWHRE